MYKLREYLETVLGGSKDYSAICIMADIK